MSDTPRTDAIISGIKECDDGYDPDLDAMTDLAMELERENAELRRDKERLLHLLSRLEEQSGLPLSYNDPLRVEIRKYLAAKEVGR